MNNIMYNWCKIGERVYTERKKNKKSQLELSGEIGLARQTLSKLERGECVNIGLDTLLKLCNIFNCEIGYLLCEYDCKTRAATDIVKETGLSEKSIAILNRFSSDKQNAFHKERAKFISSLIEDEKLFPEVYRHIIEIYNIQDNIKTVNVDCSDTQYFVDRVDLEKFIIFELQTILNNFLRKYFELEEV